jgi:hypothetical protein
MYLDLNSLDVQSFETSSVPDDSDTAIEAPTEPIDPETRFHPCTRQLTCVGCA